MRTATAERGYSTLELVVVLSIAGILITAGAFSVRGALAREEVDGWVRTIAADLSAAQQAAITRRAVVTATFVSRTYTIGVTGGGTLRRDTLPAHITFGAAGPLVFDRRGVPLPDAAWQVTVSSSTSGRTYTVRVQAGTGRVSYSEP